MESSSRSVFALPELLPSSPEDFIRAARLLQLRAGIVLGPHKRESAGRTLSLRARNAGCATVAAYLNLLEQSSTAPEWEGFINAFTINHTAFFREQHHFPILAEFAKKRRKPFSVWCCAASTGEEPYSIAMTLHDAGVLTEGGQPSILATDIDTRAIEKAEEGIYSLDRVEPVPEHYLKKYFQRGTGGRTGMVRIKPVLRSLVEFQVLNLLSPQWPVERRFDAIFCRNTMIYFDKPTQTRILERFASLMKPEGLLFAGHSENFTYLSKAFRLQGQTVYVVSEKG